MCFLSPTEAAPSLLLSEFASTVTLWGQESTLSNGAREDWAHFPSEALGSGSRPPLTKVGPKSEETGLGRMQVQEVSSVEGEH